MPLDAQDKQTLEDLEQRFRPRLDGANGGKYAALESKAIELARAIVTQCPSSPERSTALTHLDEAMLFAYVSIARHGGD